jgi:hypothetical protein
LRDRSEIGHRQRGTLSTEHRENRPLKHRISPCHTPVSLQTIGRHGLVMNWV